MFIKKTAKNVQQITINSFLFVFFTYNSVWSQQAHMWAHQKSYCLFIVQHSQKSNYTAYRWITFQKIHGNIIMVVVWIYTMISLFCNGREESSSSNVKQVDCAVIIRITDRFFVPLSSYKTLCIFYTYMYKMLYNQPPIILFV